MTFISQAHVGPEHPEQLPPHRLEVDCVTREGYPVCMGAAAYDETRCTCTTLTDADHEKCVAEAWEAFHARAGAMCDDCAFRKGSPESEELERIARQDTPFYCHKGMPVRAPFGKPVQDDYCPRTDATGAPLGYPVCAGWKRAHEALVRSDALVRSKAP